MASLEQPVSAFVENFSDVESVIGAYEAPANSLDNAVVHLAWYGYGSYCGSSLVVFEKDGKLYEVNGSHCSCNGLEGQWEPEETSWDALAMRNLSSECDGIEAAGEILQAVVEAHLGKTEAPEASNS